MVKKSRFSFVTLSAIVCSFVPLVLFAEGLVPCGGGAPEPECRFSHIILLGDNIKNALIVWIALPISGVLFAYAGFLMLTAAGDEGKIKQAKSIFGNVFVGLVLALSAWLIIEFLVRTFLKNGSAAGTFI